MKSAADRVGGYGNSKAQTQTARAVDAKKPSRMGERWEEGRNTGLVPERECGPMSKSSRLPFPAHSLGFLIQKTNPPPLRGPDG